MSNERSCAYCRTHLLLRHKVKFCSNRCQIDYQHEEWVKTWKNGEVNGTRGVSTKNFSSHLRRYLMKKYRGKCGSCGWRKKHPKTGVIPLQIDHIDGNAENNFEKNLQLLCPNCHALTPFYRNMNKGRGRKWRANKYIRSR